MAVKKKVADLIIETSETLDVAEKTSKSKFEVVNGNGTLQGTFKTIKEAEAFAKDTGFKVK